MRIIKKEKKKKSAPQEWEVMVIRRDVRYFTVTGLNTAISEINRRLRFSNEKPLTTRELAQMRRKIR